MNLYTYQWLTGAICGICLFLVCLMLLAQTFPPPIGVSWKTFGNGVLGGVAFGFLALITFVIPSFLGHVFHWR